MDMAKPLERTSNCSSERGIFALGFTQQSNRERPVVSVPCRSPDIAGVNPLCIYNV
jgi:hypothetical protein